MRAFSDNI